MPTVRKISITVSLASLLPIFRWMRMASATCSPTLNTGLREVIGSWKIIEMSRPRISRILSIEAERRSSPLKKIRPEGIAAGGVFRSRRTERAVMLLPHPDSPTSPRISRSRTSKPIFRTALRVPRCVLNSIERSSTLRSAFPVARSCSCNICFSVLSS